MTEMMEETARCGVCGQQVPFTRSNPEELMLHTQSCHPGVTAVRYDLPTERDFFEANNIEYVEEDLEVNPVASSSGTCECSSQGEFKIQLGERPPEYKLYRSKVEPWRPGLGLMLCPFCGEKNSPLIQRRKTQYSTDSVNSTFWMFFCWPLCFLPIVMYGTPQLVYLYCSQCREYLGVYDRENMRVELRKKRDSCDPCPMKAKRIKYPCKQCC